MSGHTTPITFRDVTSYFSEEEWKLLHEWQKEVYNNVMKDIQQILVSLGPLIASSVFSLRANKNEDLCYVELDNPERRHTVEHTPSGLMVNSDDVLTKNHEENQYLIAPQDTYLAENDDCIRSGFGPFISTIVLRQEHKDSLEDYPGADGEDIHTDDKIEDVGITQIVSYRVKEEGGGYSSSGQGSKRKSNTNIPTGGLMVNSDDVLTKNHEENQYLIAPQDTYLAENDDCIRSGFGPFISTIVLRQEHKDSLEDYPGADGEDIHTDDKIEDVGITQIVSYRVKEEGGGYFSSGQGSKRKSNTNIPTGIGSIQKYDRIEETDTNMFYSTDTLPRETNEEAYQHSWTKEYDKTSSYSQRRKRTPRENRRTQCTGNEIAARTSQKTSDKQQTKTTAARGYPCSECGKSFTTNSSRTIHLRTHTGEKPYKCKVCGKCFSESSKLIGHCRIHTGFKPYKCNECGKCFNQSSTLVSHKNTHTGVKPYTCGQCGKSFTQNSTLTAHVRTHTGEKPYKCNVCGKCFRESSKLIRHCRIHTGFKPYKCNECGKCFNQSSTLVSHKNTHKGVKPYTCGQCGKSFTQNSTLTAHVRRHKGGKSYSCRECRQSFNQLSSLLSHNQTHVKNKPYTCRACGKSFTQNSTLRTHLRTHIVDKRQ